MAEIHVSPKNLGVFGKASVYLGAIVGYVALAPKGAEHFVSFCETLNVNYLVGGAILSVPVAAALFDLARAGVRRKRNANLLASGAATTTEYQFLAQSERSRLLRVVI